MLSGEISLAPAGGAAGRGVGPFRSPAYLATSCCPRGVFQVTTFVVLSKPSPMTIEVPPPEVT
jgi:hypothetical protein